jgi:hypothetical protein
MKQNYRITRLISLMVILIFMNLKPFAQTNGLYIGGSLGVTFSKGFNEFKNKEALLPQSFLFSMPISYELNKVVFEVEPTYAGIVAVPLTVGYKLPFSEKVGLSFHGGIADVIYPDLHAPIQVTQKFYPIAKIRMQVYDGFIQGSYYGSTWFFSLGLRCKWNKQ